MSNDLNKCMFIGRLGKDPEIRTMGSGDQVANFSLAVGWKTKDKEGTEWIKCSVFGKLAEIVGKYATKGKQAYVEGRWQTRKWQKDGVDMYTTELNVDRVQLLGGGERSEEPRIEEKQAKPSQEDFDNDIPF